MKKIYLLIFLFFPFIMEAQNSDTLTASPVADSAIVPEPAAVKMQLADSSLYNKLWGSAAR